MCMLPSPTTQHYAKVTANPNPDRDHYPNSTLREGGRAAVYALGCDVRNRRLHRHRGVQVGHGQVCAFNVPASTKREMSD